MRSLCHAQGMRTNEVYQSEGLFVRAELREEWRNGVPDDDRKFDVTFDDGLDGEIKVTMFAYDLGRALFKGGRVTVTIQAGGEDEQDEEEEDDTEESEDDDDGEDMGEWHDDV